MNIFSSDEMMNIFSSGDGIGMETSATLAPTSESTQFPTAEASVLSAPTIRIDIILVCVFVSIMVMFRVYLDKKVVEIAEVPAIDDIPQSGENDGSDGDDFGVHKLMIEDWVSLYNKTFDSNGNRLVLEDEHIVNTGKEFSLGDNDENSSTTASSSEQSSNHGGSFEDVEACREIHKTSTDDDSPRTYLFLGALAGWNNFSRSFSDTCTPTNDRSSCENSVAPIQGTCVICFEEFQRGDNIVLSSAPATNNDEEDSTQDRCQHVYHQECMVRYLASHSHRHFRKNKRRVILASNIDSPCPICRRNFCSISEEDLAAAIKTRCLENGDTTDEDSTQGLSVSDRDSTGLSASVSSQPSPVLEENESPQP